MNNLILPGNSDNVNVNSSNKAAFGWVDIVKFLTVCPLDWNLTPVKGKRPIKGDWQNTKLQRSQLVKELGVGYQQGKASGLGVIFGPSSDGLIGVDHDGASCDPWIKARTGLDIDVALPPTVTITSGRLGRYTKFYRVPESRWHEIKPTAHLTGVKVWCAEKGAEEDEQLDFRWSGNQSVVCGIHPLTNQPYYSPEGYGAGEIAIAPLPDWVYPLVSTNQRRPAAMTASGDLDRSRAEFYMARIDPTKFEWHEWRDCLFAIHDVGIDEMAALSWSERSELHTQAGFSEVWDHIKGVGAGAKNSIGTLGHYAKKHGWIPGKSTNKRSIEDVLGCTVTEYGKMFDHTTIKYSSIGDKMYRSIYSAANGKWQTVGTVSAMSAFFIDRDANGNLPSAKFVAEVDRELMNLHREEDRLYDHMPSLKTHYIGLKDCDYNTKTNQFEPFAPEHNIWSRWSVSAGDYQNKDIKQLYLELFEYMTGSPIGAELMYLAKCGEALKLGDRMWQMVVVSGASRTGKTSYGASFRHLKALNNDKENQLYGTKEKFQRQFGFSGLSQNTTSIHIPELNIKHSEVEWFKSLIDSDAKAFTYENKNQDQREIDRNFMAYASVQDDFQLEGNDASLKNRFVHIKVTLPLHAAQPNDGTTYIDGRKYQKVVEEFFGTQQRNAELFMYILNNENSDAVCDRWNELTNSDYSKEQSDDVYKVNDPLARFFDEQQQYAIIPDPDALLTGDDKKDLVADIRHYLIKDCNYKGASINLVHTLLAKHISLSHPKIWRLMKPKIAKGETIESISRLEGRVARHICCVQKNQPRKLIAF